MLWQIKSHVISKHYFCTDKNMAHTRILKENYYRRKKNLKKRKSLKSQKQCRILCKEPNFM